MKQNISRCFALTLLVVVASAVQAQTPNIPPIVDGIVSSVNPTFGLITVAGGQITIDASQAKLFGPATSTVDFSAIIPGTHISAAIEQAAHPPGAPLRAVSVTVLGSPTLLVGTVDAIDTAAKTFTLLGLTIHTNDQTKFGGEVPSDDPHSLADVRLGSTVRVELDGSVTTLTAATVHVFAASPQQTVLITVTLIAKGTDVWTVSANQIGTAVHITSSTTIEGDPQVGQLLQILARIDNGVITAINIRVAVPVVVVPPPSNPPFIVSGILKEHNSDTIVVDNALSLTTIKINSNTKFVGDPQVGDSVDVQVQRSGNDLIALTVTKRSTGIVMFVIGTVNSINGQVWSIGAFQFIVNDATVISGSPKVGDRVRAIGDRQTSSNTFIARVIEKI